ncbi:MAG TPA: tyrosine-type recombinase/integrase [Xanthobacteraceae bacterium]|nr:tyrosine-type recombinase/integrase [Xanthobacteraceae bacterium]
MGLLSVTGLRLGEALNLKLDDIDLHNNVLTIEKAKLGKSRLVPIHRSTRKGLVKYLQRRKRLMLECASRLNANGCKCLQECVASMSCVSAPAVGTVATVIGQRSLPRSLSSPFAHRCGLQYCAP